MSGLVARAGPPSAHALGTAAVSAALLLAAAVLPLDQPPLSLWACPVKATLGLPCLTCGASHAFAAAVRLDVLGALSASPLGAVLAAVCALHLAWTLARLCGLGWAPALPDRLRGRGALLRAGAASALALHWLFLARAPLAALFARGAP